MIFLNDYSSFDFTKIQVPIRLKRCPSDHENREYILNVAGEAFVQHNCYIGKDFVQEIKIIRLTRRDSSELQWQFTITLPVVKEEDAVYVLLDELCNYLTLSLAQNFSWFQYHGIGRFSYQFTSVKRSYAGQDGIFTDIDFNSRGDVRMQAISTVQQNIFKLPTTFRPPNLLAANLQSAFLNAMKSTDPIARYILLYYMFEIMYQTEEYKSIQAAISKKKPSEVRSQTLFEYLKEQFQLFAYNSFSEKIDLTQETILKIIKTRNDLTHRADSSQVSEMMYHHLLPILQEVLRAMDR